MTFVKGENSEGVLTFHLLLPRRPELFTTLSRTAGPRPCERRSTATSTSCNIFWTPVPARTAAQTWQTRKPHGGPIFRWRLTRLVSSQNRIIFSDYKDEGNCAAKKLSIKCSPFRYSRMVILFKKSRLVII